MKDESRQGRRLRTGFVAVLAASGPGLWSALAGPSTPDTEPNAHHELRVGVPVVLKVDPGQKVRFPLALEADDFIRVDIDQRGVDVAVRLFSPGGAQVLEADRSIYSSGPEVVLARAEERGLHQLELEAPATGAAGECRLLFATRRPATPRDRRLSEAYLGHLRAEALAWGRRYEEAIEGYRQAMDRLAALEAPADLWIDAAVRLGEASFRLGRFKESLEAFEAAAARAAEERLPFWEMIARQRLGMNLLTLKWSSKAAAELERSRELADELERTAVLEARFHRARIHYGLGEAHHYRDDAQAAIDHFRRARELFDPWDHRELGRIWHSLGVISGYQLADPEEALWHFEQARKSWDALGDAARAELAGTLNQMGAAFESSRRPERAVVAYEEALALRTAAGNPCGRANTLVRIARVRRQLGDEAAASRRAAEALEIIDGRSCPRDDAGVLLRLAELAEDEEDGGRARALYRRSLARFLETGGRGGESAARLGLARPCREPDCAAAALEHTGRLLGVFEDVRHRLRREDQRLSYAGSVEEAFDLHVSLLWTLGRFAEAFETAERARARVLRDRLRELDDRHFPAQAAELRQVVEALGEVQSVRLDLERQGRLDSRQRAFFDERVRDLDDRRQQIEADIRGRRQDYVRPERAAAAFDLGRVRELLDPGTTLLEYRLANERSYLWQVTSSSLEGFELAPRAEIEAAAHDVRSILGSPEPIAGADRWRPLAPLCRLAKLVLPAPARSRWAGERLLIVADGALESVPFAALPDPRNACGARSGPGQEGVPLLASFETAYLPSAAWLGELRRPAAPPAARGWLAVVADPFYERPEDRLAGTRQEAEAILALLPPGRGEALLDRQAGEHAFRDGSLEGYGAVHLAAHGEIDPEQPALSYFRLAQRDPGGRAVDGRLFAHEIYGLRLPAELVVLSGCSTGLGTDVPGEGLVSGLSRGFFYAGARRLVVSLWQVPDTATPDLMTRFYRGLFERRETPARALRRAQHELWQDGRHPYEWAGFIPLGDAFSTLPFVD